MGIQEIKVHITFAGRGIPISNRIQQTSLAITRLMTKRNDIQIPEIWLQNTDAFLQTRNKIAVCILYRKRRR